MYRIFCYRKHYAIFQVDENNKPVGKPVELFDNLGLAAASVLQLNAKYENKKLKRKLAMKA